MAIRSNYLTILLIYFKSEGDLNPKMHSYFIETSHKNYCHYLLFVINAIWTHIFYDCILSIELFSPYAFFMHAHFLNFLVLTFVNVLFCSTIILTFCHKFINNYCIYIGTPSMVMRQQNNQRPQFWCQWTQCGRQKNNTKFLVHVIQHTKKIQVTEVL